MPIEIWKAGARETLTANEAYFTGQVWQDPINSAEAPARLHAIRVTFAPGARTAWHTHPFGQTLHVVAGEGRVQEDGGALRAIRPGDTVWIPPGVRHWHGAAPHAMMVHLAMQEKGEDGKGVAWEDKVDDATYSAAPEA